MDKGAEEMILEEVHKEIEKTKKHYDNLNYILKKVILDFNRELDELKKDKVKWIRMYCKEIGMIVEKDPLDEIFVNKSTGEK